METTKKIEKQNKLPIKSYFALISVTTISVTISLFLFWLIYNWEQNNQRIEFESWAKTYANAIESTLHEYVGALLFVEDFFDNSSLPVTRQQFNNIAKGLIYRYPGIQAFSWNSLVKDAERSFFESSVRKEGFEYFEIMEKSMTNELVRAKRREEYVVVTFIYPLEGNKPAFGFDISSNETRLKAITKAFSTGELSVTDRITLVQETGNQYGVLLLKPIYYQDNALKTPKDRRKNRKGFVVEVLRIGKAVDAALKGLPDAGISVSLYDMSADEENRFLYQKSSGVSKIKDQPMSAEEVQEDLSWSKTFDFAERQWRIVFSPSDYYYQSRKMWQPWLILFGLLLLTTVLYFYMYRKIKYTAEVEQRERKQEKTTLLLQNEIRERITAEAKRNETINKLQQALDEVRILRGILPICASCKKIRDDKGYWQQIESYIREHSEAEFSHGICPDCAKKLYPDFIDNKQDNT